MFNGPCECERAISFLLGRVCHSWIADVSSGLGAIFVITDELNHFSRGVIVAAELLAEVPWMVRRYL